jgi:hypothetical protein
LRQQRTIQPDLVHTSLDRRRVESKTDIGRKRARSRDARDDECR